MFNCRKKFPFLSNIMPITLVQRRKKCPLWLPFPTSSNDMIVFSNAKWPQEPNCRIVPNIEK